MIIKNIETMGKITASEKLRMILEFTELESLQQLAEEIGANKQNMYDINKGKCGISKNMKERILAKYPSISKEWLDDLSDVMIIGSPSISTHATGNSNASVRITSHSTSSPSIEKEAEISALKKELEILRDQLAEEKKRSEQYWEMIQKLTSK